METLVVPAGEGRAFHVSENQRLRVVTPKGQQSADFFAFRANDISEYLSPPHTWMPTRSLHPRVGDTFLSRLRRPMLDFVEDGADGETKQFLTRGPGMGNPLVYHSFND